MLDILLDKLKKFFSSRMLPLSIIFAIMFGILVYRMFTLQIVEGTQSAQEDEYLNVVDRQIDSTRGLIYDRNGNLLAYNISQYSVVMCDSAELTTNAQKNEMILKFVNLLEEYGYEPELNFGIELNEKGEPVFNVEDNALLRFKKNAYCKKSISDLTEEERNATAQEVFDFLRYGNKQAAMFQIDETYSTEETLKIMIVRYNLLIASPKYTQFTVASNIDNETVAAIKENLADFPGVEVKLETAREYNDSVYFAHILGYTGLINSTELETLNEDNEGQEYTATDVVGKIGIEKYMDNYLRGEKGTELVTISSSGKEVETTVKEEPVVGNDVYLTIDRDLQIATYNLLEKNIAEILISKITPNLDYGGKGVKAANIKIPIYEVYNALIYNNVIDLTQFRSENATDLEKSIYERFTTKRASIFSNFNKLLDKDNTVKNSSAGEEMEEYLNYMYSLLGSQKVLLTSSIDKNDSVYQEYKEGNSSLSSFLWYAITKNWINLDTIGIGQAYYSTDEIYEIMIDYAMDLLIDNSDFEKKIYRTLIFNKNISGKEICLLLFEQGVLEYNESDVSNLKNNRISAYDFMMKKLTNLEITPAQLALEPCSGSVVLTDVKTGDVLALVSYPSYDNNYLANKIDWDYYSKLLADNSSPLINRATMQKTTTGSTFKPLASLIGLGEDVISVNSTIRDKGIFEEIVPSPKCWKYPGTHGTLNIAGAIQHSCNYFYYEVGYRLMKGTDGKYSDSLGIEKIRKYATMFGLNDLSGVEIEEAKPEISDHDAVRTSIGYYHNFAPVQISRYITAIANRGTVYDYTLIDKVTTNDNTLIYDNQAAIFNEVDQFTDAEWNIVQKGMYQVVNTSANSLDGLYKSLGVTVAGKTGTAQVSLNNPHHALFVAYAPYEDPEISMAVVIPNGFASANAAKLGREVLGYYFNGENKEALLNGSFTAGSATNITISD